VLDAFVVDDNPSPAQRPHRVADDPAIPVDIGGGQGQLDRADKAVGATQTVHSDSGRLDRHHDRSREETAVAHR
jgi:hypothetical protein